MGKTYLLDTNIAIYLLNGSLPEKAQTFLRPILEETCHLSIIAHGMVLLNRNESDFNKLPELNVLNPFNQ
jgi:predicted nucleic acid-binding protein